VEANKDLHEVAKSDIKSRPLDMEGNMEKDHCITYSQSEEAYLGEEKTHEA
jgi:hypothetical protein